MKTFLISVCSLAFSFFSIDANASNVGYSNGECGRTYVFSSGITGKQGLAIRLGKEKLAVLKGHKISGMSVSFGTRNTVDKKARLFVSSSLGGAALAEQDVEVSSAAKWLDFSLSSPYTITGEEEELYVGYTAELERSASLYMADMSMDMQGCCYAITQGGWTDIYGMGYGCANIRAVVDDCPEFADMILKPIQLDGYYKAGVEYSQSGQLFNFGTETVTSFDINVKVGDASPVTLSHTGVSIAQGQTLDFELPKFASLEAGGMPVTVEIANVNGSAEKDLSDNSLVSDLFFYPSTMERAVLLEGFTGQDCGNCPGGHAVIHEFLEKVATTTPVVEVMHHAGYSPDIFSMDADYDYTLFYGSSSTFAPAAMINRKAVAPDVPVINTGLGLLESLYKVVENMQPYVSLELASDYNPATREVKVSFKSLNHNDLPAQKNVLNVVWVQDGLIAYQASGGTSYLHNNVFRGTLTGNSWGLLLDNVKAGENNSWESSFTLPEEIFSDWWTEEMLELASKTKEQCTIPVVPENMSIVAYVGAYGDNNFYGHQVYNCVKVKLGEKYTQQGLAAGIADVVADSANVGIRVDGRKIVVDGEYDSLDVYDVSGKKVSSLSEGVYIVRVVSGGNAIVKKVLVK